MKTGILLFTQKNLKTNNVMRDLASMNYMIVGILKLQKYTKKYITNKSCQVVFLRLFIVHVALAHRAHSRPKQDCASGVAACDNLNVTSEYMLLRSIFCIHHSFLYPCLISYREMASQKTMMNFFKAVNKRKDTENEPEVNEHAVIILAIGSVEDTTKHYFVFLLLCLYFHYALIYT